MRGKKKTARLKMAMTPKTIGREETEEFRGQWAAAAQDVAGVSDAVVKFKQVECYTTFLAEYAAVDGNVIIHFFPPRESFTMVGGKPVLSRDFMHWWQTRFPELLSPAAEEYFKATQPTLQAQYIPEMQSWWMRAGGFARRLGVSAFVEGFFSLLDQRIDEASSSSSAGNS